MSYKELSQEAFSPSNGILETKNPLDGYNPLEYSDLINSSGSFSIPVLDSSIEMTPFDSDVIESSNLVNPSTSTLTTDSSAEKDLLTGITNSQESLLSDAKDSLTKRN
ncbi:hypothetical protein [Mastigocoleus sp. MO_188.B34]|uniref:hypothetical protein n=1 Tax=Mastigocoleus sp. MO_188.B34 TaxID=3036635 RepID=UPI00260F6CBE|nr:hypothetical protein [Mastigocoleus sp. MO_188.B34]MDJ0692868.1 hypothetical protein [Mastigocoleus sp. MO_188.B34]